jgi:hypothetical protein
MFRRLVAGRPALPPRRGFVARCGSVERLPDEVRQDFGIGLRVELVPLLDELFAQGLIIFDHAIVHEIKAPGAVGVG